MKYSTLFTILLVGCGLSACERHEPAPTVVVPVAVPGPQGEPGAKGEPGRPGAEGEVGAPGVDGRDGGNTTVIVPPPAPAPASSASSSSETPSSTN